MQLMSKWIRVDGLKEAQPESTSLLKNLNPTHFLWTKMFEKEFWNFEYDFRMSYAPLNFLFRYKNCTKTKFLEIRHK